jgi:hypothetical protein
MIPRSMGRAQTKSVRDQGLRKILAPKINEVTGVWVKLHNEELHLCTVHQIISGSNQGQSDRRSL